MSDNKINWAEIMEQNRETIEETIQQAKRETFGTMQGWHVDIEINKKGESWTTELFSTGSQSMSSWKGETFIVTHINSWNIEIDELEEIKHDEKLYTEFLSQKEDDDGYYYAYEFMREKYPEVLQEWKNEIRDYEDSEFDAGEILDRVIEEYEAYRRYDECN